MVWWVWGPSRMEMELSKLSNHTLLTLRALIDGEITDRMMTGVLDDNDNVEREIDAMDGSARSSEESSPPRPLSHLGNLVRRMGQLDQRLQQPPADRQLHGPGGTSSSRADLHNDNPMRGLPNEDENDRASEAAVAAAKRESYTDTRTKAVIAEDHADSAAVARLGRGRGSEVLLRPRARSVPVLPPKVEKRKPRSPSRSSSLTSSPYLSPRSARNRLSLLKRKARPPGRSESPSSSRSRSRARLWLYEDGRKNERWAVSDGDAPIYPKHTTLYSTKYHPTFAINIHHIMPHASCLISISSSREESIPPWWMKWIFGYGGWRVVRYNQSSQASQFRIFRFGPLG